MLTKFDVWPGQGHDPCRSIRRPPPSRDPGTCTCESPVDLPSELRVCRLLTLADTGRYKLSDGTVTEQNEVAHREGGAVRAFVLDFLWHLEKWSIIIGVPVVGLQLLAWTGLAS
jgi:hypothetical protein